MKAVINGNRLRLRGAILKWMGFAFALTATIIAAAYMMIQYDGNFHVVDDGQVYRSAQLGREQLKQLIVGHKIAAIINLRGENSGKDWYDDEVQVAEQLAVLHIDYRLSANKKVALSQMQEILKTIANTPKPILVHCSGGADRTGLVSALYLAQKTGNSNKAKEQLSLRFGHTPFLIHSDTKAMDESLDDYLANQN